MKIIVFIKQNETIFNEIAYISFVDIGDVIQIK